MTNKEIPAPPALTPYPKPIPQTSKEPIKVIRPYPKQIIKEVYYNNDISVSEAGFFIMIGAACMFLVCHVMQINGLTF